MKLDWIKNCDFMAPPLSLTISGSTGIKAFFGVLMSIFYLFSMTGLGWFIFAQFIDTSEPRISKEDSLSNSYPSFDLSSAATLPVSFFYFSDFTPISSSDIHRYFTINMFRVTKVRKVDKIRTSGLWILDLERKEIPISSCFELLRNQENSNEYLKDFLKYKYFDDRALEYGVCVDPHESSLFTVSGSSFDETVVSLSYGLFPCVSDA